MANAIYPKYKEACMGGGANTNLLTGNVRAILVDLAQYTYSAAHEFLSSVPVGARITETPNLSGKSVTNGVFIAADDVLGASAAGTTGEALLYYISTGVEGTSRLVALLDTGQGGLPITTNGQPITLDHDPAGVFAL